MKSKVAILRVDPAHVLTQVERLCELAGLRQTIAPGSTTILKDNISWHFPFPAANTTPWQLEGTIRALHGAGHKDLVCVQNQTVVTDAFKGEDLNHYLPILKSYGVPVRYNFRPSDMTWVPFTPKTSTTVGGCAARASGVAAGPSCSITICSSVAWSTRLDLLRRSTVSFVAATPKSASMRRRCTFSSVA